SWRENPFRTALTRYDPAGTSLIVNLPLSSVSTVGTTISCAGCCTLTCADGAAPRAPGDVDSVAVAAGATPTRVRLTWTRATGWPVSALTTEPLIVPVCGARGAGAC